jgi:hypothetical protein
MAYFADFAEWNSLQTYHPDLTHRLAFVALTTHFHFSETKSQKLGEVPEKSNHKSGHESNGISY